MNIVKGDIFEEIRNNLHKYKFVAHGCNAFGKQKSGIAPLMDQHFGSADPKLFPLEAPQYNGYYHKPGNIQSKNVEHSLIPDRVKLLVPARITMVNMYTQYFHLGNLPKGQPGPVLPCWFETCMIKLMMLADGREVIIPEIGTGLGRLPREVFYNILESLPNENLTVVQYES